METQQEDIVRRIQALFRMAEHTNSNTNEAAVAMEKAQALLLEHNLTRAALESAPGGAQPIEGIGKVELVDESGHAWKVRLVYTIAKANFCTVINEHHTNTSHLFGTRSNVLSVLAMYEWLAKELEFQAMRDWKAYKDDSGTEASRTWKAAFFDGAILTLRDRLARPVQQTAPGTALALNMDTRLKEAVGKVFPHVGKSRATWSRGGDGFAAGRTAGAGMRFGPQGSLNGSARALGSGR